jgi:toxin ParE1/3/4
MGKSIVWSRQAEEDFRHLIDFIAKDSRSRAAAFGGALLDDIEQVARFPRSHRIVPEIGLPSVRELIFPPFRIIFRIGDDRIEIVRIWHAARGPVAM